MSDAKKFRLNISKLPSKQNTTKILAIHETFRARKRPGNPTRSSG